MRKVILIIITILLCFAIQVVALCPAPFEKDKAMSLMVPIDYSGRHLINMVISKDGEETIYIIGYIPYYGIIGIGKTCGNKISVYEYHEKTDEYTVYRNNSREPIESMLCIREAFLIFREMVSEQII